MISAASMNALEQIIEDQGFDEVEEWAKDHFNLVDPVDADAIREEAKADALFEAEEECKGDAPIDPLAVINSALASGQIGRTPWAIVGRGDGLILAIGETNVPIDTPRERNSLRALVRAMDKAVGP